jgi:glutamate formiminotransferase
MTQLVQCVPNFSEGRDPAVLEALVQAVRATPDAALVDYSADPDHHRSVLTFLGTPAAVAEAAFATARIAVERIDLTRHAGAHPRIGALDVLPFVPWGSTPMQVCIDLARETGERLGAELGLPVYLYEEAARTPERRNLAQVRGKGFEALCGQPLTGSRQPDFGPSSVHPTAGATAVGARGPLTAYNILLDTADVEIAREIARAIRERDGGLPGVKALGLWLPTAGRAQVSINLTRPLETGIHQVFARVQAEAARLGVEVLESELIGALRLEEILAAARHALKFRDLEAGRVLDLWAARLTPYEQEDGED